MVKCEWNEQVTDSSNQKKKKRRKKHIEIILFLCKIHFIPKHICVCVRVWDCVSTSPCVRVCVFLVSFCSSLSLRCNNTILFSSMETRDGTEEKQNRTHLAVNSFLSSTVLAYPTLVLLPFIHFTFIIRTKHIQFIWRVYILSLSLSPLNVSKEYKEHKRQR